MAETLLLVAVHFHMGNLQAIADIVRSTLGLRMQVRTESLKRMQELFVGLVLTEDVLATKAIAVRVTRGLSANTKGVLPIHCVFHLVQSRAFIKHSVDPSAWICDQLLNASSSEPIHSVLPALLQSYADLSLDPVGSIASGNVLVPRPEEVQSLFAAGPMARIPEQKVSQMLKAASHSVQALVLFYVLSFNTLLKKRFLSPVTLLPESFTYPQAYSQQLLDSIPVKEILLHMDTHRALYGHFYPLLYSLIASEFPELFWVGTLLLEEDAVARRALSCGRSSDSSSTVFAASPSSSMPHAPSLAHLDLVHRPSAAALHLEALRSMPLLDLAAHADALATHVLPQLLVRGVSRQLHDLVLLLWRDLNAVVPRRLWLLTLASLQSHETDAVALTHQQLANDPLTVLRVRPEALRCPALVEMLLVMLKAYLISSQSTYADVASEAKRAKPDNRDFAAETDELMRTMSLSQMSAVVQILLELCSEAQQNRLVAMEEPGATCDKADLLAIRKTVCSFIHQLYLADPALVKVVHFQGYETDLLPMAVALIPSMHVCFDFAAELVNHEKEESQVFGIQMVAALSERYPLPKALEVAREILGRLHTMVHLNSHLKAASPLRMALPSVVPLCRAFPLIAGPVFDLLLKIRQIEQTHASLTSFWHSEKHTAVDFVDSIFNELVEEGILQRQLNM
eukprot:m.117110 g.117110  ORF g.117110 m.117110 type:complete len:683 (-) comp16088_c0_seq1:419-2467(-)